MNRHILSIISAAVLCASPCLAGLQSVSARHTDPASSPAERAVTRTADQSTAGPDNGQTDYDLVIIGGTPGGIMTAIAAAREGKDCIILERSSHIGAISEAFHRTDSEPRTLPPEARQPGCSPGSSTSTGSIMSKNTARIQIRSKNAAEDIISSREWPNRISGR